MILPQHILPKFQRLAALHSRFGIFALLVQRIGQPVAGVERVCMFGSQRIIPPLPDFSELRFGLGVFALLAEFHGPVVAEGGRGGILEIQAELVQHEACDDDDRCEDEGEEGGVAIR